MGFLRQEYWSGLPFSTLGIFPTQVLNPCHLLGRQILYHLGSPGMILVRTYLLSKLPCMYYSLVFHRDRTRIPILTNLVKSFLTAHCSALKPEPHILFIMVISVPDWQVWHPWDMLSRSQGGKKESMLNKAPVLKASTWKWHTSVPFMLHWSKQVTWLRHEIFLWAEEGWSSQGRRGRFFFNTEGKILVERIKEDLLMAMIFKQKNNLVLAFYVKDSTCLT